MNATCAILDVTSAKRSILTAEVVTQIISEFVAVAEKEGYLDQLQWKIAYTASNKVRGHYPSM